MSPPSSASEGHAPTDDPNLRGPSRPREGWLPVVRSEREAIDALLYGFLLEAATEVYQLAVFLRLFVPSLLTYVLSLSAGACGFYFFWRGLTEWNRLRPIPQLSTRAGRLLPLGMLLGGFAASALLNGALGLGSENIARALLAWAVSGLYMLGVGSFFHLLSRRIAPFVRPGLRGLAYAATVWSFAISAVAGLALGERIEGLFVDFFTNWSKLIQSLDPFVLSTSPLLLSFVLISVVFILGRRNSPGTAEIPRSRAVRDA
jgi:hypothetical protein